MLIKSALVVIVVSTLSACASGCREACILGFGPGNPAFDRIGLAHDRADPCQGDHRIDTLERQAQLERPRGYTMPAWCGGGRRSQRPVYIYNNSGQRIATVK